MLRWQSPFTSDNSSNASTSSSLGNSSDHHQQQQPGQLPVQLELVVHDIPTDIWQLGKREKRTPDSSAIAAILRRHLVEAAAHGSSVRAIVEYTTPQHISGKHAW